jgi:flagellar hook protein FlgE
VRQDGTIQGNFTNGVTSDIGVIQVATFSNPAGLRRTGNNMYVGGPNSGPAVTGQGMSGSAGSIASGALENSNVDIALEFTKLITAQRAFQVNARTITSTDEVLQELANLVR